MSKPLSAFIAYAPADRALMLELVEHLSTIFPREALEVWEDELVLAEKGWRKDIGAKIDAADLIVFLISSDFTQSGFIWDRSVPDAYEREKQGKCRIIPVLARPCYYTDYIAEKDMLPKDEGNKPLAISQWTNKEGAFVTIVEMLVRRVAEIKEQEARKDTVERKQPPITVDQNLLPIKNLIQDSSLGVGGDLHVGEKITTTTLGNAQGDNIGRDQINIFLGAKGQPVTLANTLIDNVNTKNVWESLPMKKGVRKLTIIELDRKKEFYDTLMRDFDGRISTDQNLFYFISSCVTQCPEEIAKRMIHFYGDIFTNYARTSDDFDDIDIQELDIARLPELTWNLFWEKFKSNLPAEWRKSIEMQSPSLEEEFETFIHDAPEEMRLIQRYPILCRVSDNKWLKPDVEKHLEHIVRRFASLPKGAHKFVFLFILELDDLHNCQGQSDHPTLVKRQKVDALRTSVYDYEIAPHIFVLELLEYVQVSDVRNWLIDLIDNSIGSHTMDECFDCVLSALLLEMNDKERNIYETRQAFNMERLVKMQRHVYNFVK